MEVYKKDVTAVLESSVKSYYATILTQYQTQTVAPREIQEAAFFFIQFV